MMSRSILASVVVVALLCLPESISAQTCAGAAPIRSNQPFGVGATVGFSENVTAFLGSGFGGTDTIIAGASIGRVTADDLDISSTVFVGTIGAQLGNQPSSRVVICPFFSFSRETGASVDLGIDDIEGSATGFGGGFNLGLVAATSGNLRVIPTFGVVITRLTTKIEFLSLDDEFTDTVGTASIGAGFVFNNKFSITPRIAFPILSEGVDPSFEIAVAVTFPRR